jgi:hypothetical protein
MGDMTDKTKTPIGPKTTAPSPTSPPATRRRGVERAVDRAPAQEEVSSSDGAKRSGEKSATEQYEDADLEERTPG